MRGKEKRKKRKGKMINQMKEQEERGVKGYGGCGLPWQRPLYPECFYVLLLSAGSRQTTKAVPGLMRYLPYGITIIFHKACVLNRVSSFLIAGNSRQKAVNRLDIDRWTADRSCLTKKK